MIASTTTGMVVGERRKWPSWITRSVKRNILEKEEEALHIHTRPLLWWKRGWLTGASDVRTRVGNLSLQRSSGGERIVVVQRNFSRDLNIIYEAINFMFFFLDIKRDSNYIIAVFTHS